MAARTQNGTSQSTLFGQTGYAEPTQNMISHIGSEIGAGTFMPNGTSHI